MVGVAALLTACGSSGAENVAAPTPRATHDIATYCAFAPWIERGAPGSFDSEGFVMRALWPLAPAELRGAYSVALVAYEQVQDRADGVISSDHVTLVGTTQLAQAMARIDEYTATHCGIHIATSLPATTDQ